MIAFVNHIHHDILCYLLINIKIIRSRDMCQTTAYAVCYHSYAVQYHKCDVQLLNSHLLHWTMLHRRERGLWWKLILLFNRFSWLLFTYIYCIIQGFAFVIIILIFYQTLYLPVHFAQNILIILLGFANPAE